MKNQEMSISISTGTIVKAIAILLGIMVAWAIRDVILYVFCAMLLAGVMYPFAQWAAKYRIPKTVSVLSLYFVLAALFILCFALLVPAVAQELSAFTTKYGASWDWLRSGLSQLRTFTSSYGLSDNLQTGLNGLSDQVVSVTTQALTSFGDLFGSLAGVVVVFVLSLYIILEDNAIKGAVKEWLPEQYQGFAEDVAWKIMKRLGAWMRGQLVLGLIVGVLYFVVLTALGVPYALLLAVLGALLEFIPYIGPIVSAVPIIVLAFSVSHVHALVALIAMIIIQQMESHVIVPKVMQKTVGLNPIISIIAFLTGASLFGVPGAIFSIPLATAASVFLQEYTHFTSTKSV